MEDSTDVGSTVIGGWVPRSEVHRLMRHLAILVVYPFDDLDWIAVEQGLTATASERWFSYPLLGKQTLHVDLIKEPDADPVLVQVSGDLDDILAARIEMLLAVLSDAAGDQARGDTI